MSRIVLYTLTATSVLSSITASVMAINMNLALTAMNGQTASAPVFTNIVSPPSARSDQAHMDRAIQAATAWSNCAPVGAIATCIGPRWDQPWKDECAGQAICNKSPRFGMLAGAAQLNRSISAETRANPLPPDFGADESNEMRGNPRPFDLGAFPIDGLSTANVKVVTAHDVAWSNRKSELKDLLVGTGKVTYHLFKTGGSVLADDPIGAFAGGVELAKAGYGLYETASDSAERQKEDQSRIEAAKRNQEKSQWLEGVQRANAIQRGSDEVNGVPDVPERIQEYRFDNRDTMQLPAENLPDVSTTG